MGREIGFKLLDSFNSEGEEVTDEVNEGPLESHEVRIVDEDDGDKQVRVDKTGFRTIQRHVDA